MTSKSGWRKMFDQTKPVSACTAQELAIAVLINASTERFDAQRVLHDLATHRPLWRSLLMGRPFLFCDDEGLPRSGLLPLRDLERCWNLDTLYILTQNEACVEPLLKLSNAWGCETGQYDREQSRRLLASAHPAPIVWAWWD